MYVHMFALKKSQFEFILEGAGMENGNVLFVMYILKKINFVSFSITFPVWSY
jgi:hypothetical protein